ncbi:phasin family protein [Hyphomonas johnsonii]|jgi:predicted flap endonuclease-1-like 5' DNA nuclease|uniref:50S ribosomal protein L21 n=1 Tax=Hyphomonas johnsonii MHS-2 TaxID=1280950 RepID=A0A059FVW6_9PROT|nr:phasin family protein [Hyphomonas johnsonii]KCZ94631.1 50S ribosomal protein L21 [Hyphomonas johnsonii MHS-2]
MAKNKAKAKTKTRAKAEKVGKAIETNSADMAHKIWLAGVGAYGRAYDSALAGANVLNHQSAEVFEDLVKRGAEIETDVRARLSGDDRVLKAGQQMAKAAATARGFQTQARDQFEARMERMRDLLGVKGLGTKGEKLYKKLDKLEDEVSDLTAKAKSFAGDVNLKARLARLTAEIEAVAGETGTEVAKTAKKAAKKTSAAVKQAVAAKTEPKAKAKTAAADDLSKITGVGPAMVKKLAAEGITTYAQIAALKKAEIAALDDKIVARGRITRNNWVKQAKALMK